MKCCNINSALANDRMFDKRSSRNASTTLSSNSSLVDGLFNITVTFSQSTTGVTTSDFSVTNGEAVYIFTRDNLTYNLSIIPDGVGDVTIQLNAGATWSASSSINVTINDSWQYLTQAATSNLYYDFRELFGLAGNAAIAGLGTEDQSGNGRNLVLVGSPVISAPSAAEIRTTDNATRYYNTDVSGATFFNQNFSLNFRVATNDGNPPEAWHICGNRDATNFGLIVSIQTDGDLQINFITSVWRSTDPVFANGANAASSFDIHFDFTNDTLTVNKDGVAVPGSFTSGDMTIDPTTWAVTVDFFINSLNNNGTATSNTVNHFIYYFACTKLQSTPSDLRTYIDAKKPTFELVSTLIDADYLKFPHDVIISSDGTKAYVSGKGDASLTNVDGSFGIVDITDPDNPTVQGYANQGNQDDGETVLELSSTRVLHFVDDNALLFNVSNPASVVLVKTVANANGVGNGAAQIGDYVFSANKGGYIDVFDVSDIDNFTLVGSYDTGSIDGMIGPHDIDVCVDQEHIIYCSKTTGAQLAIVKVMNAGSLIPIASWVLTEQITSAAAPDLTGSNRIRRFVSDAGIELAVLYQLSGGGSTGDNVVVYDIDDKSNAVLLDDYSLALGVQRGATGACIYRDKLTIVGDDQGIRLLDVTTDPSNVKGLGGYFDDVNFDAGTNNNIHDIETFVVNEQWYAIATAHNEGIAIFKINRI